MSAIHDARHHVGDALRSIVHHRHSRDLLLNSAVGVDPASKLKNATLY